MILARLACIDFFNIFRYKFENIFRNQSQLLQRVGRKDSIMKSYQEAYEAQSEIMRERMGEDYYPSGETREKRLKMSRFDGSDMTATQIGLNQISKDTQSKYGSKKGSYTQLTNTGVGF